MVSGGCDVLPHGRGQNNSLNKQQVWFSLRSLRQCMHAHMSTGARGSQGGCQIPWERCCRQLWVAGYGHWDATQVLCKSNKRSWPLSRLSSPTPRFSLLRWVWVSLSQEVWIFCMHAHMYVYKWIYAQMCSCWHSIAHTYYDTVTDLEVIWDPEHYLMLL